MAERRYGIFSPDEVETFAFELDAEQVRKANQWAKRHRCTSPGRYGSAGEKCSFHFTPSGIGDFVSVHCSCGKSLDLTGDL